MVLTLSKLQGNISESNEAGSGQSNA